MIVRLSSVLVGLTMALALAGCERSPGPDQLEGEWVSDTGGMITFYRDGRFVADRLPIDYVFEDISAEARPGYFKDETKVRRVSGGGTWKPQEAPGRLGVVLSITGALT